MVLSRKPTLQERELLKFLVKKSSLKLKDNWLDALTVLPMDDGGMGSLYLLPDGEKIQNRLFGEQVSECQFKDMDGVDVIVSLNVDTEGRLLELDIWKTNYGRLLKIPDM